MKIPSEIIQTFIEVKGFFPIAIDVLTGLVVMLTSRLVISTVACILILRMVDLKLEDLKIRPVEIGE